MKHLFLLRHAKSSWDEPGLSDFDRPLAARGRQATERLARYIGEQDLSFDLVVCSSAARARETWERISARLDADVPVSYDREIYLAGAEGLLDRLHSLDDGLGSVLLVGHNPDMEMFADALCADGDPVALALMGAKYPTGALAEIRLACERWSEAGPGSGTLESFTVPRALPAD